MITGAHVRIVMVAGCAAPRLGACAPPAEAPTLIAADLLEPAAGICGEAGGGDRHRRGLCRHPLAALQPPARGERFEVGNRSAAAISVTPGPHRAALGPGETFTFETPPGSLLAPGVHNVRVEGGPGLAFWIGG